ncbi:MAG: 4-(cytidine 5'-diphospho)-2-C-methyl-D-erythritol kinase [Gemmatimonadota bacterium]
MHAPYQRTVRAHAKVNLLLRVLAREASGFHGIETVFQRLALHDIVHVSVREEARTLECDGPMMPPEGLGDMERNLAWRAAQLYMETAGWESGWHIAIEKRIPVGGGLGGGSADAAAVLHALESMSPAPLGAGALLELGGTLGSDLPFLLSEESLAVGWGRGDRLLALPALPRAQVLLFTFGAGVNTGVAYAEIARTRNSEGMRPGARAYEAGAFASWSSVATIAANDFESVVPGMHTGVASTLPLVQQVATDLRDAGTPAIGMLSGSGATIFLLTPVDAALPSPALDAASGADAAARARVIQSATL